MIPNLGPSAADVQQFRIGLENAIVSVELLVQRHIDLTTDYFGFQSLEDNSDRAKASYSALVSNTVLEGTAYHTGECQGNSSGPSTARVLEASRGADSACRSDYRKAEVHLWP